MASLEQQEKQHQLQISAKEQQEIIKLLADNFRDYFYSHGANTTTLGIAQNQQHASLSTANSISSQHLDTLGKYADSNNVIDPLCVSQQQQQQLASQQVATSQQPLLAQQLEQMHAYLSELSFFSSAFNNSQLFDPNNNPLNQNPSSSVASSFQLPFPPTSTALQLAQQQLVTHSQSGSLASIDTQNFISNNKNNTSRTCQVSSALSTSHLHHHQQHNSVQFASEQSRLKFGINAILGAAASGSSSSINSCSSSSNQCAPNALFKQPTPQTATQVPFPWTAAARGKPRRGMMRRAVFSDSQRVGLEKRFQLQKYISKPDRKKLAERLGLRDSQVKIWFQNRRMKWRNVKERELLSAGGSREQTLPTRSNPNPDLSDVGTTNTSINFKKLNAPNHLPSSIPNQNPKQHQIATTHALINNTHLQQPQSQHLNRINITHVNNHEDNNEKGIEHKFDTNLGNNNNNITTDDEDENDQDDEDNDQNHDHDHDDMEQENSTQDSNNHDMDIKIEPTQVTQI